VEGDESDMREDTLKASVQYGDFKGTAAADHHDRRHLSDLAEKYGVDTDRYFVFGINIYIGETRGDKLGHTLVAILAVETHVVKAASVDSIQRYVDEHEGKLAYVRFDIPASLEEDLLSFKRFNVVLTNSYIQRVTKYQQASE